jgi:ferritin-like metal-binding protein YciE
MKTETVRKISERQSIKTTDAGTMRSGMRENQTTSSSSNIPHAVPKEFLDKLAEMHRSESELAKALPLVKAAAKSKDLKALLNIHLKETQAHVKVLQKVAVSLRVKLPSRSCPRMTKLIGQAVKIIAKRVISGEKDQALIRAGQKIEQFEIANYGPLCSEAERLDFTHEAALLISILGQEKLAYELLESLAQGKGPLDKLVERTSLKHAAASSS